MDENESYSDIENIDEIPNKKKKRYNQKYSTMWENQHKYKGWVRKSIKGNEFFYCTACKCDLKCSGGGRKDLDKHLASNKHVMNAKG